MSGNKHPAGDAPALRLHGTSTGTRLTPYGWALLAVAAASACAAPLQTHLDLANIVMLYLLAVVLVAFRLGRGPAVVTAVVGVAAFDFFFVPPRFSFAVADAQYLLTLCAMLVTGLVIAHLAERLKREAAGASAREQRARDLYELARQLSAALQDSQILEAASVFFAQSFCAGVTLLVRDRDGGLTVAKPPGLAPPPATFPAPVLNAAEATQAQQVFAAEGGVEVTCHAPNWYVALRAPMRVRGVLVVAPQDVQAFDDPDQRRQLDTAAVLIAIALERVHFVTVAHEATVNMEGERLRNVLLSALSHDLRTPLTAIRGAAESLGLGNTNLSAAERALVEGIREQALRTNDLVENILDMARLESGAVHLRREWQSLEEIIGSAIKARGSMLGAHLLRTDLARDLPLVECDATLIERVLVNLLENAAKYTPPGSAIMIAVRLQPDEFRIHVCDTGNGIPPGREQAIFDKFVRAGTTAVPGLGLGLAICRSMVAAHGGQIWAEPGKRDGAEIVFTLPRGQAPQWLGDAT